MNLHKSRSPIKSTRQADRHLRMLQSTVQIVLALEF